MDFFQCYHSQQLTFPADLSISISPTSVTCRLDRCCHRQFNPKPLYFFHLAGGRVTVVHEEASPNKNKKRTTNSSLITRLQGAVVLFFKCVCCNTETVTPHQRRLCILHAEHSQLVPPQKQDG